MRIEIIPRYVLLMLLLGTFISCDSSRSADTNNLKTVSDSLFRRLLPMKDSVPTFVYYVDASCSVCIATAIDCYRDFQESNEEGIDFIFMTDLINEDIFRYYLGKCGFNNMLIVPVYEPVDIGKGLYYTGENGQMIVLK